MIQSKLDDFEVDVMPGDWEAIEDRLPKAARVVPMWKRLPYWAAAAAVSLAIIMGGLYSYDAEIEAPVAQVPPVEEKAEPVQQAIKPVVKETVAPAPKKLLAKAEEPAVSHEAQPVMMASLYEEPLEEDTKTKEVPAKRARTMATKAAEETPDKKPGKIVGTLEGEPEVPLQHQSEMTGPVGASEKKKKKSTRKRWNFGMGGGSISAGSSHLTPQYVTNSSLFRSEELSSMNAFNTNTFTQAETDIKHKTPINLGFSVGYSLNDRFSLQSGLTYSYLRSTWSTNNTYHIDNDQRLHFIGIPLSLAFKIAEWNKFLFYTSAGAMTEVNVAGKRKMNLYSDDVKIAHSSEHVRMKEWLWSVNARAGVSYPIIRFISAFAEVGASYYFDNGSEIETIHSEKPFNVNLQLGFRFGF